MLRVKERKGRCANGGDDMYGAVRCACMHVLQPRRGNSGHIRQAHVHDPHGVACTCTSPQHPNPRDGTAVVNRMAAGLVSLDMVCMYGGGQRTMRPAKKVSGQVVNRAPSPARCTPSRGSAERSRCRKTGALGRGPSFPRQGRYHSSPGPGCCWLLLHATPCPNRAWLSCACCCAWTPPSASPPAASRLLVLDNVLRALRQVGGVCRGAIPCICVVGEGGGAAPCCTQIHAHAAQAGG